MEEKMKIGFWCALFLFATSLAGAADLPAIRRTAASPFSAAGIRIEKVWKNADTFTGLVNAKTSGVELCSSRIQALYDENNLYLSLTGTFRKGFRSDRSKERKLFSDNNFEIFLKPEAAEKYSHIAVSESGLLYTGIGRNAGNIPGIRKYVFSGKDHWRANLIIPLKSLQLTSEDQKLRINFCRYNIDMPTGQEQQSSYTIYGQGILNYHVPDQWSQAVMTSEDGKPAVFRPHSDNIRVNLIPDPGFDFVTLKFTNPDVQRVETAPLSRVWLIRATGKAYHFYSIYVNGLLQEGREYTLKVRARRIGKEGAFGIIQLVRRPDGKFREGKRACWGIPLTGEFQEYYLPFKADGKVFSLPIYRLGTRSGDTGVEIENISLYEGRISAFEIRKVSRAGVKNIVPGTGFRMPDNPYGRTAKPLSVLVIGTNLISLTDPTELFTGLNVEADMLATTGRNADVYYTISQPEAIFRKLKQNRYDLYMIGGRVSRTVFAADRIGSKMTGEIVNNVKQGAGLFLNGPAPYGNFAPLLRSAGLHKPAPDHLLNQALPIEFLIRPAPFQGWNYDILGSLRIGKIGRGTVVTGRTGSLNLPFQILHASSEYAAKSFPWNDFNKAWLARLMYYIADRLPTRLTAVQVNSGMVKVTGSGFPDGAELTWRITDKSGNCAARGKGVIEKNSVSFKLPELSVNGKYVIALHALDPAGHTLDYTTASFERKGPCFREVKDRKLYYSGKDHAELAVVISRFRPGLTLAWSLEDFSGRILQCGTAKTKPECIVEIPLESLYTNLGRVEIVLMENGKKLDTIRIPIVAQDRDKKRVLNDFTPAVWNFSDVPYEFWKGCDRQLEKIGFRAYTLPFYQLSTLNSGMGVGSMWREMDVFYGRRQTKNIRYPQFNTPESRKKIQENVRRRAAASRRIGVIQDGVCDEPGLIYMNDSIEVDEHPANIAEYRIRMKNKYGSIEKFNRRMGSAYESFDQLKPGRMAEARKTGRYGEFIEWRNFNVDRWCEAIKLVADAAKAGDPNSSLSLIDSFGETALGGNDYWKLLTRAGLNFSHEYTSMVYQGSSAICDFDEFYRSFRPDMRVWGFTGYFFDRAKAFFQPWWFALHRYGGFTWFSTFGSIGSGGGAAWLNILDYTGAFTQDAQNLSDSLKKSRLQNGLGKVFLDYEWVKNDIAVYYSHDSVLLAFIRGKETRNGEFLSGGYLEKLFISRQHSHHLLEELLFQYDFLAPEQIVGGKLKERKVLFMPGVCAMSDAEVKAVKDFIAGGGLVIADFMPGTHDELGFKRQAPPFTASEVTVLEAMFNDKDATQKQRILDELLKAGSRPLISVADAAKIKGREAMHFVHGNMHVFAILRDQTRSKDSLTQTFTFPVKGHLYDLRAQKYLGFGNQVTAAVPLGDAAVWGVYPYQVNSIQIQAPDSIQGCRDFSAALKVIPSEGVPGIHILHAELIPPQGEARFFLKRNLTADRGQAEFKLRIAENDPDGVWTFRVTDSMTGVSAEKKIRKKTE